MNNIEKATELVKASKRVMQCYNVHVDKENKNEKLLSSLMYVQGQCNLRAQKLIDEERKGLMEAMIDYLK